MRHKADMVGFEAARAMVALPHVTPRELGPAISTLHVLLTSPKSALRYAAVRTLHALSAAHPLAVSKCNDDLEGLVADANKAIATLAITTLLKTGADGNVDRLVKQISGFLGDVGR